MTTTEPTPEAVEALARLFHEEYERAAVGHGWETQKRSRVPWEDVPEANKATMLTTCRAVLAAGYVKLPTTCPDDSDMCDWLIQRERNEVERLKSDLTRFADGITALSEDLHPHPLIRKIVGPSLDVLATEARAIRDYDPTGATIAFPEAEEDPDFLASLEDRS